MRAIMKEFGEIVVKLSRNPLGVIAATLVLVYAISTLAFRESSLGESDRHVITWFVALYPVLVFVGLCFLVACHHQKLYAPADFANEQLFALLAGAPVQQQAAPTVDTELPPPASIELMILNTLWINQVNLSPDFKEQWCFRINANTPVFLPFHYASGRLIERGFVSMTDQGMIHLTRAGFKHCRDHFATFPPASFYPENKLDPKKLEQALLASV